MPRARKPSSLALESTRQVPAGVGKGTVFRRFGDRAGLMGELISEYMRDFQDAFLTGPAPLGPGAPPAERLVAFLDALVVLQREHLPVALAAETRLMDGPPGVYGALYIHTVSLIREIDQDLDADVLAALVLAALAPPVLQRLDADSERVSSAVAILLAGITDRPA
jgi:AcrR family transcriptional regulator